MNTVADYEKMVQSPGKFEMENRYVPYFYDDYLGGLADDVTDDTIVFRVMEHDVEKFPELEGREFVKLFISSDGFIQEVDDNIMGRER